MKRMVRYSAIAMIISLSLTGCTPSKPAAAPSVSPSAAASGQASPAGSLSGSPAPSAAPASIAPTVTKPSVSLPPAAASPAADSPKPTVGAGSPAAAASPTPAASKPAAGAQAKPQQTGQASIDHIVIVVEENHSYKQIVSGSDAPYFQSLIKRGALFTDAHGITHPSQPNYLALFSGSTQGVKDDSCTKPFSGANLASELAAKGYSFAGYSEDLPQTGFTGCSSNGYARKHNPWVQFSNVPPEQNLPFTAFPQDFTKLPTVSFVIPNHKNDMHDGTVKEADDWLKSNLSRYVEWAQDHNSMLIVTWDEDDFAKENHIPLVIVGPMVKPGLYGDSVNHYHVLRMIEDLYGLPRLGESGGTGNFPNIWK